MREPLLRLGVESFYETRGDLCLCLSGGGFRAAGFHLGVIAWLRDVDVLQYVAEVRAVSGGALAAGWMARNASLLFRTGGAPKEQFEATFASPFRQFIASDIRTGALVKTAGLNLVWKAPRVRALRRSVSRLLGDGPVEAHSGVNFRLTAFDVDSERAVELDPTTGDLANQVVASAAFPPLIGPVTIHGRRLVDGGVASNLGVAGETLQSWRCVVISDASRVSPQWLRSPNIPVSLRLPGLLRDGANRATRNFVAATDSDRCLAAVVPLSHEDWYGERGVGESLLPRTPAARFRTDLAGFNLSMVTELERAGSAAAKVLAGDAFEKWSFRIAAGETNLRPDSPELGAALAAHAGLTSKEE